jgi:hypothetical protein
MGILRCPLGAAGIANSPFAAKNGDICQIGKISGPALAVKNLSPLGNVE